MFGNRINIIDFMVIIFILFLTPCFYYGWKLFMVKQPIQATVNKTKLDECEKTCEHLTKENDKLKIKDSKIETFFKRHPRARKYFE